MINVLMIAKAMEKTGVSSVMLSYYDQMNRSRFKIDFATGDIFENEYKVKIEADGSHFYIIPGRDKRIIHYILKLSALIKHGKYEIVHVHGNSAMIFPELIAAWLGGAKVRIAHSHNTMCNHPHLEMVVRPLFLVSYTHALACSIKAGKWMFRKRDFFVIKNGIQVKNFVFSSLMRQSIRQKLGIGQERIVGHVGYFNYQKNHERLLSIFEKIHETDTGAKLLLIGEGGEKRRIQQIARDKKLSDAVIFYGQSDNIPGMMAAMDCFLLPSHFEGFGIVLLEAQAAGLPCVASCQVPQEVNVTGTVDYLGLNEKDEIWAEKVIEVLYRTPEERERRSLVNSRIIKEKEYDIGAAVGELEAFYERALNG